MIFINSSLQVLLLLRDDNKDIPFPNCWDIPGGMLENGETPQECIQREMREELELELQEPRLFRVYELEDRREYSFWKQADFDIATLPLHEGQRLQWFSLDEIRGLPDEQLAFGFKSVLLDFYAEQPWRQVI
jgi:8-oxo-dGTP diphosphatase